MRRRQFLRAVGAAAAGAAIAPRGAHARPQEASAFLSAFQAARGRGRPLLIASVRSLDDEAAFEAACALIRGDGDRELAVRLLLVELFFTADRATILLLTNDRAKEEPPSLALIDGEEPRVVKEAPLDGARILAGLARFLRDAVPLKAAWLASRVALLSRNNAALVKQVRERIAAGRLPGALGQLAPAVVVLEAVRRKRAARDRLLADLVAPPPAPAIRFDKRSESDTLPDCGLGAQLIDPLGERFASEYTNGPHGLGRNHAAT